MRNKIIGERERHNSRKEMACNNNLSYIYSSRIKNVKIIREKKWI